MIRRLAVLLLAFMLLPLNASAETEKVYTMTDESGKTVAMRLGKMYVGDEYISHENLLYEIVSVDDEKGIARAVCRGEEKQDTAFVFSAFAEENAKLICMYSTHSDESYIPGDGDFSLEKNAGIYDVGNRFKQHLEKLGFEVEYSEDTFLPHDAGAYRRSRSVAADFAKKNPAALIDIHRDGIPKEEYETTVDGEKTSMVRLFVGKSNENAGENRAFAKRLKAIADEEYPGLVKDIYIGKGNYNQDLFPNAILLEFGTHEMDKKMVLDSTEYMASVLSTALDGQSTPEEKKEETARAAGGAGWLIALVAAGGILIALLATGSLKGAGKKLKDGFGEITGGIFSGKKKK